MSNLVKTTTWFSTRAASDSQTAENGIAQLPYVPNMAGNMILLLLFLGFLLYHVMELGRRWRQSRAWTFGFGMGAGLLLECIGYGSKVKLHFDGHGVKDSSAYIAQIIGLVLGPTFISASLYVLLSRYISLRVSLGCPQPLLPIRVYTPLFITGDAISIVLIGVGGSLAAIYAWSSIGVDLMIGGLAAQVGFTGLFILLGAHYQLRCFRQGEASARIRSIQGWRIATMSYGLALASCALFARSVFRIYELSQGFNGGPTQTEWLSLVFDGAMMVVFVACLSVWHPAYCFPQEDLMVGLDRRCIAHDSVGMQDTTQKGA